MSVTQEALTLTAFSVATRIPLNRHRSFTYRGPSALAGVD